MKVLVTGASGFVGSALLPALGAAGHEVVAASRQPLERENITWCRAPELGAGADWRHCLRSVEVVIHLAGRAHSVGVGERDEMEHNRVNFEGTSALARQAAACGIRQFIFLSSCHAVAENSELMLDRSTPPRPQSAYGRSKLAAEQAVTEALADSSCSYTILRAPLVYGPHAKANLARLCRLIRAGFPLPLAGIANRRSFVGLENLTSFIVDGCLGSRFASDRAFYPSDGEDVSTPQLAVLLARAYGCKARLFPVPKSFLSLSPALGKLSASLFVDAAPNTLELGWKPSRTMREELQRMAAADYR